MPESADRPTPGPPSEPSAGPLHDLPSHYVVEAEIGRGGMGTVLRAHDLKHDRKVAIKLLRPEIARSLAHERFLLEIRTVARLVHPNILTVVDSGEAGGTLYFVMPYVEGESLRDKMEREGRLEMGEALRIVRDVAGALHYAHAHGIVHRDVKPENILLSKEGQVWLVDFGIARAAAESGGDSRLTSTGLILGSPLYTSPEQASGDKPVDGRSDLYSLGCVLYEALAGVPPFGGPKSAILLQHLTRAAASLREHRPELPDALDSIVLTLLAKSPEDRFKSAAALQAALDELVAGERVRLPANVPARRRHRFWYVALAVAGGVVLAGTIVSSWIPVRLPFGLQRRPALPPLDSTRYLVLRAADSEAMPNVAAVDQLVDGLRVWSGVDVVSPAAEDASANLTAEEHTPAAIGRLARVYNAGRVVQAQLSSKADSVRIALQLIDGNQPEVNLVKIYQTVPAQAALLDATFLQLADSLLLRGTAPECYDGGIVHRSLNAIRNCDGAFSALQDGDIARADTLFEAALRIDPADARAALWLAEIRSWIVTVPPDTRALTRLALDHNERLTPRETALGRARTHLTNAEFAKACDVYQQLIAQKGDDYVAWIGLGECHRRDAVVRRDPRAPTGWSFRSSYHRALLAYRQVFELRPSLLAGYRDRSFAVIRTLFVTSTADIITGRATLPDTTTFNAYIQLRGDTVAFVPVRSHDVSHLQPGIVPESADRAVELQVRMLRNIATTWARRFPNSVAAQEGLTVALELDGDPAALGAAERATSLSADADERLRLAAAAVLLQLKFAMPDNLADVRRVQQLADSLVQLRPESPSANRSLIALALLLGRPSLAAQFARKAAPLTGPELQLPSGLAQSALALLVFAAAGGPADSILRLEQQVNEDILNGVSAERRSQVRLALLTRPVMIAFPSVEMKSLPIIAASGAFTSAEYAFARKDTAAALSLLQRISEARTLIRPAGRTLDALYAEAWLLNALGRPQLAIERLDPTLNATRWFPPMRLGEAAGVGPWLRALVLRADIARTLNDSITARRIAEPVNILWSKAEASINRLTR